MAPPEPLPPLAAGTEPEAPVARRAATSYDASMNAAPGHCASAAAAGILSVGLAVLNPVLAGDGHNAPVWPTAEQPAYVTSPYHGVTDGNGHIIPCRCRYQGQEYRLGDLVCMSTHVGVVMTRCDLLMNNTSWVPTGTACTVSRSPEPDPPGAAVRPIGPDQSSRSTTTMRSSTNVTR